MEAWHQSHFYYDLCIFGLNYNLHDNGSLYQICLIVVSCVILGKSGCTGLSIICQVCLSVSF